LSGRIAVLVVPAGVLVAVAAVALRLHFQPPTVPPYTLAGDAGAEVTLLPGTVFEMVARPSAPSAGVVAAKGFLFRGQEQRLWEPPFTVDVDGTVHVAGAAATLFKGVPAGAWDIALVVGRPETLPTMPGDVEAPREAGGPAAWHVLRERVNLTAP
jgi:hypothetical protein